RNMQFLLYCTLENALVVIPWHTSCAVLVLPLGTVRGKIPAKALSFSLSVFLSPVSPEQLWRFCYILLRIK
ncbi:hypothetical protein, partial [Escherichia coli]|uniref:hypothetical protein n=1 Tax=Escherichia coli TaxID=562 RepID=UPI0021190281